MLWQNRIDAEQRLAGDGFGIVDASFARADQLPIRARFFSGTVFGSGGVMAAAFCGKLAVREAYAPFP